MITLLRWIARCVGGAALIVGLITAVASLFTTGDGASLGEIWFAMAPDSLNLTQAITQRYLHPAIWDPGLQTLLVNGTPLGAALLGAFVWLAGWALGRIARPAADKRPANEA